MKRATGTFEVSVQPLSNADVSTDPMFGRFLLVKKFSGAFTAEGRGQMLSAGTPVQGSAGYVAIDHITGTLEGKTGAFVLQHVGTMGRGAASMSINVLPDSGTGGLAGIAGTLTIRVVDKQHYYDLDYSLPES